MPTFLRGAIPTPAHKIALAVHQKQLYVHRPLFSPPPYFGKIPKKMSVLGNSTYGDCVSAEAGAAVEAYSTDCVGNEYVVQDDTVINFARQHNWLNGADLLEVCQAMQKTGMKQGNDVITEGPSGTVDLSDENALQAAIATGPVKFGMDANALPQGAGNQQAWGAFGGRKGQYGNEDHCMGFFAYGPVDYLIQAFNDAGYSVTKPANAPSGILYVPYTWATCGIADHDWIMSTAQEAYVRSPTTIINGKPLTPTPAPPPVPWYV